MTAHDLPERPLLYRPEEAARALGMSRARLFQLIANRTIESVKLGASRRIPASALDDFVRRLRTGDESHERSLVA